ncbi:RDD family protein [Corallococcus sp. H22C18031201]|uniref:RDD family protein n=1 Tax=Citreicoccus inhibens TaxID=2849499 RepID=UPI000E7247CA|nr:RDD family protein [Citreicoccus inhibens]MBU8899437.1 RDD family protein [Citreicoccus inhibens]RJS17124.1 RDD family protein [Corallococcus sp. H22C18031201]
MSTSAPAPHLDVATPERVALTLPVAGIGYRCLAWLVDASLLFAVWVALYFIVTLLLADVLGALQALSGVGQTLLALGLFATQWLYWTLAEVFFHGQTVGKRVLGIRVVRVDGSPVGVFESAVRNICRVLDFLPVLYATGCITMLLTRQHRRLGDLLAGTVLVREEAINLDAYTTPAAERPAPNAAERPLSTEEVELVLAFLSRARNLEPEVRKRLGTRLVDRVGAHLSDAERAAVLRSADATETFLRVRARAGH